MTILDAYALVALLADEPAAQEVDVLLRSVRTAVSSVNLAEAVDIACRVHRVPEEEVREAVAPLLHDLVDVVAPAEADAWRAAQLRVKHYDRRRSPLSLADCFLLATATTVDRIATADQPVATAARSEGIAIMALPDTGGRRP